MNPGQLDNLKAAYVGKYFKWIRPVSHDTMGNMIEVGDIVRCTNVKIREVDKQIIAEFHMGPSINVNIFQQHLEPYYSDDIITPNDNMYEAMGIDNPHKQASAAVNSGMMSEADIAKFKASKGLSPTPQQQSVQSDLFQKFATNDTKINIGLELKMPNMQLVQLMYESAADKNEFISDLASYVSSKIDIDNIKISLMAMIGNPGTEITVINTDEQK